MLPTCCTRPTRPGGPWEQERAGLLAGVGRPEGPLEKDALPRKNFEWQLSLPTSPGKERRPRSSPESGQRPVSDQELGVGKTGGWGVGKIEGDGWH